MMSDIFDFIHRASKSNLINLMNLQSELKINNDHYPNVEMV